MDTRDKREGQRMLGEATKAYARMQEFSCEVVTTCTTEYVGRPSFRMEGSAKLRYRKGEHLLLSGRTAGGPVPSYAYELRSNRSGVSLTVDLPGMDSPKRHDDIQSAIVELSGITYRAPVLICSLLLRLQWRAQTRVFPSGELWSELLGNVRLLRREVVGGDGCFVVSGQYASVPVEIWIRIEDHMIVACKESWTAAEIGSMQARNDGGVTRREIRHVYTDIEIK